MSHRRSARTLRLLRFGIAAAVLYPYAVTSGEAGGRILVHNATPYYLHVIIGETPYLYVRPGHWVRESSGSGSGSVDLRAFYAPAQGVEAFADTVLQITETTTSTVRNDCSQSPDCEKTTEARTSYSSVTWEVTPGLMNGGGR